MTVAEMETKLDSLIRQCAREEEAAKTDPRVPEVEEMRKEIVALKNGGRPYAELMAQRDALVAEIMSQVNETRRERRVLREKLRAEQKRERMEKYQAMATDDLRFKLAQHQNAFRAEKAEANAIRRVIDARHTENEARQLVEAMSDAQRAALLVELQSQLAEAEPYAEVEAD